MPELPEVEVTRRGIAPALENRRLASADFRIPALRYPLPHAQRAAMLGQRLHAIERRAKYLLLRFDQGTMLIHLGMSGSLRLMAPGLPAEKHDHVDLEFGQGAQRILLRFRDPRRFGALLWLAGEADSHPLLKVLGIEPLTEAFTARWLKNSLEGVRSPIKPTLMDSHRVVGIGNIYASESLFRAGIDPRTPAGKISLRRLERLVPEIKATLLSAIEAGGSSLRDFIHSDGSSGYFQQQYFAYGRAGQPCYRCNSPIRELRQSNRASFYCARCQR
ncbi:MAG: bifunctional DNA-formamidopyrimidine glycosylase/DNA-(apurinic or apyrimidinic site) lyase [Rhodocyclaceae bacterium]|jgi:formamidopyrimidine-DNA glycosylase|nr:bifunctional DNA-formamidopyrimidine glycosylase/DNA-(apurinic or apyrimidinic site) lyase [Rhodocyclaceae bacterium]